MECNYEDCILWSEVVKVLEPVTSEAYFLTLTSKELGGSLTIDVIVDLCVIHGNLRLQSSFVSPDITQLVKEQRSKKCTAPIT